MGAEWDRSVSPIYEAAARGKCVLLLKTLLTGNCRNECAYCAFRTGRNCQRITGETKKLAHVTMQLWKETKICGLFLSPSFSKDPDDVMELHLEVLRTLRKMRYTGYIHLRMMPRVSRHYVKEAVELADLVEINLEAPNKTVFDNLCPNKGGFNEAILKRLTWIVDETARAKHERQNGGLKFGYGRAGVGTQMIVDAVNDNDCSIFNSLSGSTKEMG